MHPQFRISARRRGGRLAVIAAFSMLSALAVCIVMAPSIPVGASALSSAIAGAVQMRRSHAYERSLRAASGAVLILAAAWWLLLAMTGRADWQLAAVSCAVAAGAAWLVWAPHSHPALVRHTTGFGDLDGPQASATSVRDGG